VGKKIRNAQLMKAPYVLVIGDRELEAGTYTVRDRAGTETAGVTYGSLVSALRDEADTRSLVQSTFGG
jgi:threonyl-tRNA synthetase